MTCGTYKTLSLIPFTWLPLRVIAYAEVKEGKMLDTEHVYQRSSQRFNSPAFNSNLNKTVFNK